MLRAIPLVAVTAFAMVGDQDRILEAGFDGYITKPITPKTFVKQAEAFLQSEPDLPPAVKPVPLTHATILVVDNSPANREFLQSLLEYAGYRVAVVSHIEEALALARQNPPDLILSDLHLQGGSGLDFLTLAKADPQLGHIPFVIISSTVWQGQDQIRALNQGATKFILRPIEPKALLAEIEACLAERPQQALTDQLQKKSQALATILVVDDRAINRQWTAIRSCSSCAPTRPWRPPR
jgi:two-component system cell cycle response regulator